MTGAYVRVQRDGRWQNVEYDQLTDEELEQWMAEMDADEARKWLRFSVKWMRDNVYQAE